MQGICEKIIRTLCPCLIRTSNQQAYENINYEKEEFLSRQEHLVPPVDHPDLNPVKIKNNQLESSSGSRNSINSINSVNSLETYHSQQPVEKQKIIDLDDGKNKILDYSDVILESHSYYGLFKDKLVLLPHLFQVKEDTNHIVPETDYPLKIYCQQSADGKTNTFTYFFVFPTTYETYQMLSNDFALQKQFDNNIDQFSKMMESPQNDTKIMYLSYKKVLIVQPRDFIYVRYTFKKGDQYWSISTSDPKQNQTVGKVRGEIVLTATKIIEKNGKIQVSISSQVDMKMPIKAEMAKNRGFAEIRKYLDKIYAHLKSNSMQNMI